ALDAGGATLAVLPIPLPAVYPPEHRALAAEIATRGGLLVSERRPGARAERRHFVLRNRIQTGLSLAVVVVETGTAGGTMHTVRFAERQDRPVFVPYLPRVEASVPGCGNCLSPGGPADFRSTIR